MSVCVYLRAGLSAVHNGVTAVEGEGVLQLGQTLLRELITRVDHPTIRLFRYEQIRRRHLQKKTLIIITTVKQFSIKRTIIY